MQWSYETQHKTHRAKYDFDYEEFDQLEDRSDISESDDYDDEEYQERRKKGRKLLHLFLKRLRTQGLDLTLSLGAKRRDE